MRWYEAEYPRATEPGCSRVLGGHLGRMYFTWFKVRPARTAVWCPPRYSGCAWPGNESAESRTGQSVVAGGLAGEHDEEREESEVWISARA